MKGRPGAKRSGRSGSGKDRGNEGDPKKVKPVKGCHVEVATVVASVLGTVGSVEIV
jgi:hypothetical protein